MADDDVPADPAPPDASGELARLRARVAALEAGSRSRPLARRARSALAVVLIVLGCLLAPLGAVAAWSASIIGDTDRYVATVRPLASNRHIQAAVADLVTDAAMTHLDLEDLLSGVAPAQRPLLEKALGALGGSLQGAVRSLVHDKAEGVVASDAFRRIWVEANRRVHRSLEKAITGRGGGAVSLDDDTVTVDLAPVVDLVKQRLVDDGLTVAGQIPEIHTRLTVLRSDDLGRVRTYVRVLQLAGPWVPVLAILLVAAGVWLSAHRRRTLIVSALCFAFATFLLGVALTVFRVVYLDALPANVSQPAAGAIYDTLTRFLRTSVRVVVALGLIVALAAWLTGPYRHAVLLRRLWHAGIGAVRATADRAGLRTGPVGPFVRRFRTWITWTLVAAAALTYVLWPYPTGWVVVGLALTLLLVLSVVDFLGADRPRPDPSAPAPETPHPLG
ncbi:hypothetical protein ACIQPQ_19465 [Streptomyces sp. NPDC091281]|uniref:hypothetical protein n=1 Tax=Streptomyces sp. NPDC091281 TaxID=3365985 RepID=UPI0038179AC0